MANKTCPYNPREIQCEKTGVNCNDCSSCGWNPKVANKRRKKIRADILAKGKHSVFVYSFGGFIQ